MKLRKLIITSIILVFSANSSWSFGQTAQQDVLTKHDKEINEIIKGMSLEEKVRMLHSKTIMSSEGIPRLGISDIKYSDGPFGIREEIGERFRPLGWKLDSATYFPTGSALAATWSPDMAYKYGSGMGREGRRRGKDMILGPAINIQRLPVGGRTYEYLSEDPYLSGALATAYVKGTQDQGIAVCIKHYALNNQENDRGSVNVVVDERTMREIYLKPFENAVREGGAYGVMPAYNKVNGTYCSENNHLNNDILRGEWGFKGITVSDWGGTHSTMGAALGGLDIQMTGDNYLGPPLIDSLKAGKVSEEIIDNKVREILRVRFTVESIPEDAANIVLASQPEEQHIAYEVATKSVVLLKNEKRLLPIDLSKVKKIAVVGENAVLPTAFGGMGAGIKSPYEITPLQGLKDRIGDKARIVYVKGYESYIKAPWGRQKAKPGNADSINEPPDPALLAEAVELAGNSDIVLYFAGTNKSIETEGSDRDNIMLPTGQDEIAKALAMANPNLVTIIISGGPCDLRVVNEVSPALVLGWWNGLEGGHALADILLGKIAPSGKLPMTFPVKLGDSPAYALGNYPQAKKSGNDIFVSQYRKDENNTKPDDQRINQNKKTTESSPFMRRPQFSPDAFYSEGLLVGYRWYDTKCIPVMYPFGYGLSYVTFEYSDMKTNKTKYRAKDIIKVTFNLTNKGDMEADEVAELYVHRIGSTVEWPEKELKGFRRMTLKAGETREVTIEIPVQDLSYWNKETNKWDLENGTVELLLGKSSQEIVAKLQIEI